MARARNIKPAFFTNDDLADIEPLGRLLFIGLWTICDYKGDLEWRQKRVKAQILPYDNCDIQKLAINLDKSGFVRFYSVQSILYLNIVNFEKHQNPHINEKKKGSDIPGFTEEAQQAIDIKGVEINLDKSGLKRNQHSTDPADSLILIPDPPTLIPDTGVKTYVADAPVRQKGFIPPTTFDVNDYMITRGLTNVQSSQQADTFCDFYASKNWFVGKSKMKDWKASVRNWLRNYKPTTGLDMDNTDWINDMEEVL